MSLIVRDHAMILPDDATPKSDGISETTGTKRLLGNVGFAPLVGLSGYRSASSIYEYLVTGVFPCFKHTNCYSALCLQSPM